MRTRLRAFAFSTLTSTSLLYGAPAWSDDAPPAPPPPPNEETQPRPPNKLDDVRVVVAHVDRVVFGSTAETHPQGTFFFTDYEILLLQFGYAVTDELQLSIAGLPPIVKDQPYFFDFGLKLNVVRGDVFRAALKGALDVVTTGGSGSNTGPYWGGRIGGVGQLCFELTCRSSLSLDGGALITSGAKDVLPIYGALGAIVKVSSLVSLLPALLGALGTGSGNVDSGAFFFLDYGVRLSGKNFGVDLTVIKPLAMTTGTFNDPFILGYPYVVFTYRTDGDRKTAGSATAGGNFGSVARSLTRAY
jgi:hypothetical protein